MTTVLVGLDLGHGTVRAAEHWLHELVDRLGRPAGLIACTHLVREPHPHVAVSLNGAALDGGALNRMALDGAAQVLLEREGGRAVVFPGVESLTGIRTIGEVLASSAIERVVVLGGGGEPPAKQELDTRDFVRPQWMDGRLTLVAQPARDGRLVPFESPTPTPCCADHP